MGSTRHRRPVARSPRARVSPRAHRAAFLGLCVGSPDAARRNAAAAAHATLGGRGGDGEAVRTILIGCLRTSDSTAHLVGPVSD